MAVSENPYRRRPQWNDLRWRPQSQIKLVGIGLTVLFILQWHWDPDPFGCESIERLLSQVRHEHPPRWTIIQQHDMKKSGGVVLFWHLTKTGGSTIRGNVASRYQHVDYRPLLKQGDWNRILPQIERRLGAPNITRILLVELHGQGSFSNGEPWPDILQTWRTLANVHRTNFFVFSILREPLSHAISYYNFFHKHQVNATENMLKEHVVANQQCATLSHDYKKRWWFSSPGVTDARICAKLYKNLLQQFDWIGTTKRLENETLPLLHQLLTRWTLDKDDAPQDFASYNIAKSSSIHGDTLSAPTLDYIHERTCLDRALWNQVQRDFPLTQVWNHYS